MFEGVQAGDRCLSGSKHMCLPAHIYSLAHRRPPATGTDEIPALLSPPNTRSRASPGAQLTCLMPVSQCCTQISHRSSHPGNVVGLPWDFCHLLCCLSRGTCCRAEAFPDYSSSCFLQLIPNCINISSFASLLRPCHLHLHLHHPHLPTHLAGMY